MQTLINYLGDSSYPAIVETIREKLMNAEADTISGNEILKKAFVKLNESITPVMDLKEFTTNAEVLAPNDAKLCDIVNFVRTKVKSGDLNFLINMCKEQHFSELTRTGFPNPQQTIEAIKSEFNEPSSVIEAGIKKGLFDALQSNLLMEIKSDLKPSKNRINKDLEKGEHEVQLFENFALYPPVGIRYETDDRVVMLTESVIMEKIGDYFSQVPGNESPEITLPYRRLMVALQSLPYNPEDESFTLDADWDFELQLQNDGKVVATVGDTNQVVANEDVPKLLLESINTYAARNLPSFNKQKFIDDADNFTILMENHGKLIKMDDYKVLKNVDNGDYVILNTKIDIPAIIASSLPTNEQPQTFQKLMESVCDIVGTKSTQVLPLFENQINLEQTKVLQKQAKINSLMESQQEINMLIDKNNKLKSIAEPDSAAFEKLFEQEQKLDKMLNENLKELRILQF